MAQAMRRPVGGVTLEAIWDFMLTLEAEIKETRQIEARNANMLATALALRAGVNHNDSDIINANADIINSQVSDTLSFQDIPWEDE